MHNRKPVDTEDPKNFTKLNKLIYIFIYIVKARKKLRQPINFHTKNHKCERNRSTLSHCHNPKNNHSW